MNDLIIVANIILDCDEMIKAGEPVLDHIKSQCRKHGIMKFQDDILNIVNKTAIVHNVGSVNMDYSEPNIT